MLIGADLAPTKTNISVFSQGDLTSLLGDELISILRTADCRIFNLEAPLTDLENPIRKLGPHLIAPTSTIKGIKFLDPTFLCLANNHILDQGYEGLLNTMELLAKYDIGCVGAGKDLLNASKPLFFDKNGLKIGIYACAENEFSIAEDNKPGANPFDPLQIPDDIVTIKSGCDFLIVLYHGGKENYRYPSPNLQKVCRKLVEKGADLVICQHSHCIGSYEIYSEKTILYGQGNFLFDRRDNEFTRTSLLVKVTFGNKMTVDYIPVCKKGNGVVIPDKHLSETILNELHNRSEDITKPGFIDDEYEKLSIINAPFYLSNIAGFGENMQKIDRLLNSRITRFIYSSPRLTKLQNFMECEAHRELILRYLRGHKKS